MNRFKGRFRIAFLICCVITVVLITCLMPASIEEFEYSENRDSLRSILVELKKLHSLKSSFWSRMNSTEPVQAFIDLVDSSFSNDAKILLVTAGIDDRSSIIVLADTRTTLKLIDAVEELQVVRLRKYQVEKNEGVLKSIFEFDES